MDGILDAQRDRRATLARADEMRKEFQVIVDLRNAGLQAFQFHTFEGQTVAVGLYEGKDGKFHGAVTMPTSMVSGTEVRASVGVLGTGYTASGATEYLKSLRVGNEQYTLLAEGIGAELQRGQRAEGSAVLDGVALDGAKATLKRNVPMLDQDLGTTLA